MAGCRERTRDLRFLSFEKVPARFLADVPNEITADCRTSPPAADRTSTQLRRRHAFPCDVRPHGVRSGCVGGNVSFGILLPVRVHRCRSSVLRRSRVYLRRPFTFHSAGHEEMQQGPPCVYGDLLGGPR